MGISLQLESATDTVSLDDLVDLPTGVQALAGATGFGLPPVAVQWLEGAGNGARYRGRRAQTRTFDLPIYIDGGNRPELKALWRRLVLMLMNEAECRLRLVEEDGSSWWIDVIRTGGGDLVYGQDTTGEQELRTVLSLTAGYPLWTAETARSRRVQLPRVKKGLLPELSKLQVMPSAAFDSLTVDNRGDAPAPPVWKIVGPGTRFEATSPSGESLVWAGSLLAEESLTFDVAEGTVIDHKGVNRYDELGVAPRFWSLPPGQSTFTCRLSDASPGAAAPGQELRRNFALNPSARGALSGTTIPNFGTFSLPTGAAGAMMSTDAPKTVVARTNLARDPRLLSATWPTTGVTASKVATGGPLGFGYTKAVLTAASSSTELNVTPTAALRIPVTGATVTLSTYVRAIGASYTRLDVAIDWYGTTGAWIGSTQTVFSGSASVPSDWSRFSTLPRVPPTGAVAMSVLIDFTATGGSTAPVGAEFNVAGFLVEESSTVNPYFDGATATIDAAGDVRYTHAWTGTANASTSTQAVGISPQPKGPGGKVGSFARCAITTAQPSGATTFGSWNSTSAPIAIKQGDYVTLSVWLRYVAPPGGPDSITVQFEANVVGVNNWWGHPITGPWLLRSGEWVRLTSQIEAAYQDLATASWRAALLEAAPAGASLDATGVLIEQGLNVGTFFDGDTATSDNTICTWTGTSRASASIQSESIWKGASEIQCIWRDRSWAVI